MRGRCGILALRTAGFGSRETVRQCEVAAYLPELSYAAIDPQRVRGDAGDPIAVLAELPQRGGARRRAGVQRAATAGATTCGRFRLRALPYYAGVGRRGDQHRRRRRLTRAAVVAALHALSSGTENITRGLHTCFTHVLYTHTYTHTHAHARAHIFFVNNMVYEKSICEITVLSSL